MSDSPPDRPERWGPWLLEAWIPIGTVFLVVLAVAIAWAQRCEPAFRYCSALLQVAVIITVIADIVGKRQHAGRKTARERFKAWWRRRPWRRRTTPPSNSATGGGEVPVPTGTGTAVMDPGATLAERVAFLEQRQETLANNLAEFRKATGAEFSRVDKRIDDEADAREKGDRSNKERFDEGLAGGLDLAMAGVVVLLFSLLLATLANNYGAACRLW